MKYLSIDIEATGLEDHAYLIEFAAIPFDSTTQKMETTNSFHTLIKCPPFDVLRPSLNPWVIEHNQTLIENASQTGVFLLDFKEKMKNYLNSSFIKNYFNNEKVTLFGKSLNALDLPLLKRDLGSDFFNNYFSHKVLDLTSFSFGLIDLHVLPEGVHSSSELMNYFKMGQVAHTAYDDAKNTALIYFQLINLIKNKL